MKEFFRTIIRKFVEGVFFLYCKIFHRARIYGKENIPKEGPLIFCGNHRTFLDPVIIKVTAKRDMRFLAKEEFSYFRLAG